MHNAVRTSFGFISVFDVFYRIGIISLMDHTPGHCQFTNLSKYTNFTCEKSGAGWTAFKQCLTPVTVNPGADVGLLGGGFLKSGKRADRSQLPTSKSRPPLGCAWCKDSAYFKGDQIAAVGRYLGRAAISVSACRQSRSLAPIRVLSRMMFLDR